MTVLDNFLQHLEYTLPIKKNATAVYLNFETKIFLVNHYLLSIFHATDTFKKLTER
jgi:hypothetical protein